VEKVEVITEVDKNVSKNEIAKAYGKSLFTRSGFCGTAGFTRVQHFEMQ
jgi:hypothetical protein